MGIFDTLKKKSGAKELAERKAKAVSHTDKKIKETKEVAENKIEEKQEKVAANKKPASITSIAHRVIVRPLVTEKSAIAESHGVYAFAVDPSANKIMIKQAIHDLYGVTPVAVRCINMPGKVVRFGRFSGRRSEWKKALVTLKAGDTIQIHAGV